ncbi:MAG: element excision factor XisH family protein [Cyanobacteriota bacterium]|nr:element excision factor XisH family protein [Cyanobacteriota bacterium]
MPRHDLYHDVVKQALTKDGWVITDDPFIIRYKGLRLYADLAAEKLIAAQNGESKIVIEVKVFRGPSLITELEKAVGQYGIYRTLLQKINSDLKLYLAIDKDIFQSFFRRPAIEDIVSDHQINMLVFDPDLEEIVEWIN